MFPDGFSQITLTMGSAREVEVRLDAAGGAWECLIEQGGCGRSGRDPDHLVALGAATVHNVQCARRGQELGWFGRPKRVQKVAGPAATVVVMGDRWECRVCGEVAGPWGGARVAATAGVHALMCGAEDTAAAAQALGDASADLYQVMGEWVERRVEDVTEATDDLRRHARQLAARMEAVELDRDAAVARATAAVQAQEAAEQRLNGEVAEALLGDADRLRAATARPDTKASVLAAASVGAVIAAAGPLTTATLPTAAVITGGAAVAGAVIAVAALLVAMRPSIATSPDALVTSDIRDVPGQVDQARRRVQDLDALAREREALQRLARAKFGWTRYAIDAAMAALVLTVATVLIALIGGAA